jgi:hypothetical protein
MTSEEQIKYDIEHKLKGWRDPIRAIKPDISDFESYEDEVDEPDDLVK